jgi:ataxia telangiectasia mutated family protein
VEGLGEKKKSIAFSSTAAAVSAPLTTVRIVLRLLLHSHIMSTLAAVLSQIKSEKIKERQEGLTSLRHLFQRDSAVLNLDETGDGRAWLAVFQALFTAVANEKAAYTKKEASKKTAGTSAAVLRRLSEAASVVRWLTERSVQRMNSKVCRALLSHLLQSIVFQGQLFAPLALDYVKTLRCLIAFTPHLDHLEEAVWIDMVELSFNVILGDSIRTPLKDETYENDGINSTSDLDDDDLYDNENNAPSTSAQPRKRRRTEYSPIPRSTPVPAPAQPTHPVTLEQIEFTSFLASLLQSGSAPFLSSEHLYLPGAILSRLRKFVHIHSSDTSLHQDYFIALSATLSRLALNKRELVRKFAWDTWESLVGMWKTRVRSVKEGLVTILRILFPFVSVSHSDLDSASSPRPASHMHGDGLGKLWHLLDAEAESRWGVDTLSLDALRLQLQSENEEEEEYGSFHRPFVARTFRSCGHFDAGQALAWAVLELQADCAEKVSCNLVFPVQVG